MCPYKDPERQRIYKLMWYAMRRTELINALGARCVVCRRTWGLEVHHIKPYGRRSRPNSRQYFSPKGKELRCLEHHSHTESWRRH